ncbi:MAG: triosephosphate isomerase, partial [Zetaproteobacteria bacterium]
KAAWEAGLEPVLCIGEHLEERERGETEQVLSRQLSILADFRDPEGTRPLTIAYEPVWAIGTGRTATPEIAEATHAFVHEEVQRVFGRDVRVLYGGSVKPENAEALMERPGVDGALVGGASLQAASFNAIIEAAARACAKKRGER